MSGKCCVSDIDYLESLYSYLSDALIWRDTPQGGAYWVEVSDNVAEMIRRHYDAIDEDGDCSGCVPSGNGASGPIDYMAITKGLVGGK